MRKNFDPQLRLDSPAVLDAQLNVHCRDEIVPILWALQHLYGQPKVRASIRASTATRLPRTPDRPSSLAPRRSSPRRCSAASTTRTGASPPERAHRKSQSGTRRFAGHRGTTWRFAHPEQLPARPE